ncbi:DUF4012 domain-containing protein [Demequina rhizosphaerae]|uniref:DUF4012 domain-containing protein n=1 Tax=Demequina rhizosphaerae TaxID=1638985 RepID=UPI0007856C11|nr:DUF4012 domain-containing protein [Demequina rhizosphaerae]
MGDDGATEHGGDAPQRPRGRARRRGWRWAVAAAVLLVPLTLIALFAFDGYRILTSSSELQARSSAAVAAMHARDTAAFGAEAEAMEEAARTFESATHGPHWWLASHVPWVEDQAVPLMAAGAAVGAVAQEAVAPLASLDDLDALAGPVFADGRVDPSILEPYRDVLAGASVALDEQSAALASVDLAGTVHAVREPFGDLADQVDSLARLVDGAHLTAELLPTMLGGDGERRYLVVVQNNAEPRTTGGISGAFLELTVDDGRMSLGEYRAARDLVVADGVAPLTADEERIYTDLMAIYPQDANFTPEYPRAAELLSAFWQAGTGGDPVDGVVSVDPVVLGWMLEGAPVLETRGLAVSGANLSEVLLNEAYFLRDDPVAQDQFFVATARELFGRIVSGQSSAVAGVERALESRRFLLWSAHPEEQELLAGTAAGGAFLESADTIGVFLNDGSGSKIGYYVDTAVAVTDEVCLDGTVAGETLEVTLDQTFDGDPADLPAYVSGGGQFVPEGEFQANLIVYVAPGTRVASIEQDGKQKAATFDVHGGRSMLQMRVTLEPGGATTVTFALQTTDGPIDPADLIVTPGARDAAVSRTAVPAAGC